MGAKVGAKAKVSVKKPKAKASLKVKAKKTRRLQSTTPATTPSMNVSTNGVDLNNAKFAANVQQPTAMAGDGQTAPAKSWMMFTGLMMFVAFSSTKCSNELHRLNEKKYVLDVC